jgi:hypothetical protein
MGDKVPAGSTVVDERPQEKNWVVNNNTQDGFSNLTTTGGELLRLKIENSQIIDGDSAQVGDFILARLGSESDHDAGPFVGIQVISDSPSAQSPAPLILPHLRKLQITEELRNEWRDLPRPGEPGYPLGIAAGHSYQVRAVFDHEPYWGFYKRVGVSVPTWQSGIGNQLAVTTNPQLAIQDLHNLQPSGQLYTIKIQTLGSISTALKITPDYKAIAEAQQREKEEAEAKKQADLEQLESAPLRLFVQGESRGLVSERTVLALRRYNLPLCRAKVQVWGWYPSLNSRGWKLRLVARHADGKPAGRIYYSGTSNDFMEAEPSGQPGATFEADDIPGLVSLWAEVVDASGRVIKRGPASPIYLDSLKFSARYDRWKPSANRASTWEREVHPLACWQHSIYSTDYLYGISVTLRLSSPTPASAHNASLSGTMATTQAPYAPVQGKPAIKQFWTWAPNASRDLDSYEVEIQQVAKTGGKPQ